MSCFFTTCVWRCITEGIHAALEQARKAANGRDARVGGGVATVRQYLQAGLVDELHLAIRPVVLGKGEHLWYNIDMRVGIRVLQGGLGGTRHAPLFAVVPVPGD
jgi:dihydrofolate reductase